MQQDDDINLKEAPQINPDGTIAIDGPDLVAVVPEGGDQAVDADGEP